MNFLKIVLEGKLKDEIREIEKKTGGVFAGLSVSFNDFTETWMDENLTEIEKPELVKKVEKYLKKVTQGYTKGDYNEDSHSTIQHTPLTEWTG